MNQLLFQFKIMKRKLEATKLFVPLLLPILSCLCNRIQLLSYSHIITFHPSGLTVSLVWQKKPNYSLTLTLSRALISSLTLIVSFLRNSQSVPLTSIPQHASTCSNVWTLDMFSFAPLARKPASAVARTKTHKHDKWFHSGRLAKKSLSTHSLTIQAFNF